MASNQMYVTLNTGAKMPAVGLGTWTVWQDDKGIVKRAVKKALECGYRHIDAAHVYKNEREVGAAIQEAINEGLVKREDIFVTTKLWNTFHRRDLIRPGFDISLKDLGLKYVDLYLVHWPMAYGEGGDLFPKDENDKLVKSDADLVETWKGMEELYDAGLAKAIGISNFNSKQVQRILDNARINPCMNQLEINAYFSQEPLIKFCRERDVAVTAYAPLGAPGRTWGNPDDPVLLEDPLLNDIAKKKNKTVAQVAVRNLLQRGLVVVPKSVNPERIEQNFQVFDFELSNDEMTAIAGINKNFRAYAESFGNEHNDYPFHEEF